MRYWYIIILFVLSFIAKSQDITPPDTPVIDSVSVYNQETGEVIISWLPSDSADVAGYIIYRSVNALWQIVGNVPASTNFFIDNSAAANFHPELYRIAAYDEANNFSPMTPSNQYHNTIYVFPYIDSINCHYAIRLNWNRYISWAEGVKEYQIYVSENYGPWTLLQTVPGNTNQYFHMNINDNTSYCYMIRAISNANRTSTSNKTCFYTNFPNLPLYIYARYATVENNAIKLLFELDTTASICRYKLLKAKDDENYSLVKYFNLCNQRYLEYVDNEVNLAHRYKYKLVAIDLCDNVRTESNIATNVVLNAQANEEVQNILQWTNYKEWPLGIDSIYIYRSTGGLFECIYSGLYLDTFKIDDLNIFVLEHPDLPSQICYYVKVVERSTTNKAFSCSNIACANQFLRLFLPNTFSPNGDGLNDEFRPSNVFIDSQGYEFKIFDRWGNEIWQTTDPKQGWDGRINGRLVSPGMYKYLLRYKLIDGTLKERSGPVYVYFP